MSKIIKQIKAGKILVNKDKISVASKKSYSVPQYWESYLSICCGCGARFPISADWQKAQYEINKRYIWDRPNKCPNCYREWIQLKLLVGTFPFLLRNSPSTENLEFMRIKLDRLNKLQSRRDWALCARVIKLLKSKNIQFQNESAT